MNIYIRNYHKIYIDKYKMYPLTIPKHLNKWNKQVTILYDPQKQNTNKNKEQSSYREEELPEMG